MTFTHFLNCSILTYAPIYVIFSAKNLQDHRIGKFFLWGIVYYIISTLAKMLLYATVIPYNVIESESYDISQETLKIVINCIEIFFIILALRNKSNFIEGKETGLKILTVAIAWALAENLFSYFLYYLANATSDEFSWEYLQTAVKANIDLLERISIIAIVESFRILQESNKISIHLAVILICKFALSVIGEKYIPFLKSENEWINIQNKAILAIGFGFLSKMIYNSTCVFSENNKKNN